jgi:hypothetical protein
MRIFILTANYELWYAQLEKATYVTTLFLIHDLDLIETVSYFGAIFLRILGTLPPEEFFRIF